MIGLDFDTLHFRRNILCIVGFFCFGVPDQDSRE